MNGPDDRSEWTEPDLEALTGSESRADDRDVAERNGAGPITLIPQ